jgi:hypothetical protein
MRIHTTLILLMLVPIACGQESTNGNPSIEFSALTHEQLTRKIFAAERNMIAGLADTRLVLETYLQSLWPNTKAQSPIDDAYFLSAVDFKRDFWTQDHGRRGYQTFLFGQTEASRRVRVNNGKNWKLIPDGYLDMMFVDIEDFDSDTYELKYLQKDSWGGTSCLKFSVIPKKPRLGGQFEGQIWVETSNFKIVRIKGTFTASPLPFRKHLFGGEVGLYFTFDSVRQEVIPGTWLPSYTYFDENRRWQDLYHNGETDFHYRGHTFIWGYNDRGQTTVVRTKHNSDAIGRLEKDKLLANPGLAEQQLNGIVRQILAASNVSMPDIECRILLTTPIEIFSINHTIVLSRGLLNILPDQEVIAVLLAHEIGDMMIGAYGARPKAFDESFFDEVGTRGFQGLGILRSPQKDAEAWKVGLTLASTAGYSKGVEHASLLFGALAVHSPQIPNLVRPRFGLGLLNMQDVGLSSRTVQPPTSGVPPLLLRGEYVVDSWRDAVYVGHQSEHGVDAQKLTPF